VGDRDTSEYVDAAASLINFSLLHPERQLGAVSVRSESLEIFQRVLRVTSFLLLGQVDEADAEIVRFADLVRRSRHPQARWYIDLMRSTRALMEGQHDDYAQLASRYLALGEKYGDRNAMQSYAAQSLMRAFDLGGLEVYETRARSLVETFPSMVAWRAGLVLILAELDRVEDARSELYRLLDAHPLENSKPNEWYGTATGLALACAILGEPETSARLYAELHPHANQLVVFGYCSYCMGSTHRLLAALATGMKRWETADSHFEAARARNTMIGARACNARVYFEHARMLRAAERWSEANHCAERAEELASEFRMIRLVRKCRELRALAV
jgi:tetratricopeptide (TPR) repeat protein